MAFERIQRIYADKSVFGGPFDQAFAADSRRFFELVRAGTIRLVLSDVVFRELEPGPTHVREFVNALPAASIDVVTLGDEAVTLRDEYIRAGVVGPRWLDDAAHVALASVSRADFLTSWNFRHLVRIDRIRQFNAVNMRLGYSLIEIRSPKEIVHGFAAD